MHSVLRIERCSLLRFLFVLLWLPSGITMRYICVSSRRTPYFSAPNVVLRTRTQISTPPGMCVFWDPINRNYRQAEVYRGLNFIETSVLLRVVSPDYCLKICLRGMGDLVFCIFGSLRPIFGFRRKKIA